MAIPSLFHHTQHLAVFQWCRDCQDGVVGSVETLVECTDIVEGGLADMLDIGPDGGPTVGVGLVA